LPGEHRLHGRVRRHDGVHDQMRRRQDRHVRPGRDLLALRRRRCGRRRDRRRRTRAVKKSTSDAPPRGGRAVSRLIPIASRYSPPPGNGAAHGTEGELRAPAPTSRTPGAPARASSQRPP
jgi:hypothetical protein